VPWLLHGVALALLPWLHTRFAVLAGTLGGLVLVRIARTPNPLAKAVAFLAVPAASALGWLFFFTIIYGSPDPSAPYGRDTQNALAYFPNGVGGLLFDQGFGLFAAAPILAVALAGFVRTRRLALEWLVVALPYLLAVATYAMWWAGMSGPARFLVPLILPLAIPAACLWSGARSRASRILLVAALLVSAWISIVMAGDGAAMDDFLKLPPRVEAFAGREGNGGAGGEILQCLRVVTDHGFLKEKRMQGLQQPRELAADGR
jgi:hypothetical protein